MPVPIGAETRSSAKWPAEFALVRCVSGGEVVLIEFQCLKSRCDPLFRRNTGARIELVCRLAFALQLSPSWKRQRRALQSLETQRFAILCVGVASQQKALDLVGRRLDQHSFQTGITAILGQRQDVQLDARVGFGFVNNVANWLTGVGISWRLPTGEGS